MSVKLGEHQGSWVVPQDTVIWMSKKTDFYGKRVKKGKSIIDVNRQMSGYQYEFGKEWECIEDQTIFTEKEIKRSWDP